MAILDVRSDLALPSVCVRRCMPSPAVVVTQFVTQIRAGRRDTDRLCAKYARTVGDSRSPWPSPRVHPLGSARAGFRGGQPWWSALTCVGSDLLIRRDLRALLYPAGTALTCWSSAPRCAMFGGAWHDRGQIVVL